MILLVTNKQDFAADRVVRELDRRRAVFARLNTEDFPTGIRCRYRLGSHGLTAHLDLGHGRQVVPEQLTAIWYRRPEPSDIDARIVDPVARRFARRESDAALRGFLMLSGGARWVNHPDRNRAAGHKLVQLAEAKDLGLRIPETLVTNDPDEAARFCTGLAGPTVVKTVGPAFIAPQGRSQVYTSQVLPEDLDFAADIGFAPLILQERIDKRLEVRVTVVGDRVLAAAIDSQASPVTRDDWRRTSSRPHTACIRCLTTWPRVAYS